MAVMCHTALTLGAMPLWFQCYMTLTAMLYLYPFSTSYLGAISWYIIHTVLIAMLTWKSQVCCLRVHIHHTHYCSYICIHVHSHTHTYTHTHAHTRTHTHTHTCMHRATTHTDLIIRASEMGISYQAVRNASINECHWLLWATAVRFWRDSFYSILD